MPDDELTEIRSGVARVFESQRRRRRATTTTSAPRTDGKMLHSLTHDEGIVRLQVQPEQPSHGGLRRSTRVRTALLYDPRRRYVTLMMKELENLVNFIKVVICSPSDLISRELCISLEYFVSLHSFIDVD